MTRSPTPVTGPRMLRCRSANTNAEARPGLPPGRARVRIGLSERVVRMASFGVEHVGDRAGWWRRVEQEMGNVVFSHLPEDAVVVRMDLDAELLEVEVEYDLPVRGLRPPAQTATDSKLRATR